MLAYTADMPIAAKRTGSPKALALIVAGHALVLAGVLTAKPEIVDRIIPTRPIVFNVPPPPDPKPIERPPAQAQRPAAQTSFIDRARPIIAMEQPTSIALSTGPTIADIGAVIGSGPTTIDPPRHLPVRLAARLATPEASLKPPYPDDKLRAEEEATLKLKLTIDAGGRVTAVEPIGATDPSFLKAARRHILRSWRYQPATEDGVAVPTSTVVSLSFRLEDV